MFETYYEIAALKKHVNLIELFDSGLNPNEADESGDYLLNIACEQLNEDWFEALTKRKVNPNSIDSCDNSPLMELADISHSDSTAPMMFAKTLIDSGADVNFTKKTGDTIFLRACLRGNKKFVQLLIDAGANVHASYMDLGQEINAIGQSLAHGNSKEFRDYIHALFKS